MLIKWDLKIYILVMHFVNKNFNNKIYNRRRIISNVFVLDMWEIRRYKISHVIQITKFLSKMTGKVPYYQTGFFIRESTYTL